MVTQAARADLHAPSHAHARSTCKSYTHSMHTRNARQAGPNAHLAKGSLSDDADRAQLRPLNLPLVGLSSKHGALLRAVGRAGVVRSINCMRSVDQAAGRFASTAAPGGGWKGWQAELSRGGTSQQHCNAAHSWRNPAAACRTSNMHSRHSRCSRQSRHSSSPRRHPRFRAQAGSPPPGLTGTPGC